ncbi:MAG: aminotransferase class V-fold PLP-dependent enzyme [Desulfobacula sp.]|uniref:threonine aldolase family protein n=1 Tax=Desulfobacula sp. TaxID=2593537 RepID=UPI0025C190FB|nr:aminotransferase class V-fold PLP-dependent enzyme [Desulfobacula sp.]MCD4722593.1 aminotransferase class V-fold PLP-dependent enzyme [Desulfobacula sp.]
MTQYNFKNDYCEGAHPRILEALGKTNFMQEEGYGQDNYCIEAIEIIRQRIKNPNADIHFVSGGTQANLIVIASILKPYESVIATTNGHIAVHEAGAIEATGHKVNIIETRNGKLNPQNIESVINLHEDEHMVKPKLVFISNSTETGNIYRKKELKELSSFCKQNNLFLYLDGARLGSALTSEQNDLTLPELSKYLDIFYIGGTKNGALLGEAIVINNKQLKENFRFHLKQKGALLAKGRILGIQFLELFKDDLFFELGRHANSMAAKISKRIEKFNYEFLTEPVSNQIFPILPDKLIEKLSKKYKFYVWNKISDHNSAIRIVTSWATKEEIVDAFISDIK